MTAPTQDISTASLWRDKFRAQCAERAQKDRQRFAGIRRGNVDGNVFGNDADLDMEVDDGEDELDDEVFGFHRLGVCAALMRLPTAIPPRSVCRTTSTSA
jgi:hypothetical protein